MVRPGIVAHPAIGRRLTARLIYRADFLAAFFLGDVIVFFVATGPFFRFLDATAGVATPVLTASFPSAVPMASAAVVRNGAAWGEVFFFAGMAFLPSGRCIGD
jgi:hypothetical protein